MRLSKSQKAYAVVLGLALVALLADRVFLRPGGRTNPDPARANAPGPGPSARPPAEVSAASSSQPGGPSLAARLSALASGPDLDPAHVRDAFVPSARMLPDSQPTTQPKSEPSRAEQFARAHRLTSVVLAGKSSSAIVDGQVIQLGQQLDGFRLVSLTDRIALFQTGQERVELKLQAEEGP